MVSASVARATDGAAPNRAAKLLGLKIVPRIEKPETKKPPTKKRISTNFSKQSSLASCPEVYEFRVRNQMQNGYSDFEKCFRYLTDAKMRKTCRIILRRKNDKA